MKCELAQRLILTDYADGGLDKDLRREIDEHARICAVCSEIRELVLGGIRQTLTIAKREEPPAYIWENVRHRVASGKAHVGISVRSADFIRNIYLILLKMPRPIMAFAATVIIIIAVLAAIPGMQRRALDDYLNEQITFMAKLDAGNGDTASIFDTNISTGVDSIL